MDLRTRLCGCSTGIDRLRTDDTHNGKVLFLPISILDDNPHLRRAKCHTAHLEASQSAWDKHPKKLPQLAGAKKMEDCSGDCNRYLARWSECDICDDPLALVIGEHFHVADTSFPHSFWPVTVWNTGAAIGPMVGMPILENFGIRKGYMVYDSSVTTYLRKTDCLGFEASVPDVHRHGNPASPRSKLRNAFSRSCYRRIRRRRFAECIGTGGSRDMDYREGTQPPRLQFILSFMSVVLP